MIAIAPEPPEGLAKTREKSQANFALVGDSGTEALRGYGVGWQQSGKAPLPAPAVFVVGADGAIAFHYVNPRYQVRIDPAVLMAAVRAAVK